MIAPIVFGYTNRGASMRRSDRAVTKLEEILAILDQCEVLRLALCRDNKPYIVPMNFAYHIHKGQLHIYVHSARQGTKLDIVAENPHACFEVDCNYATLRHEEACEWSATYQSVVGEGRIRLVEDSVQKSAMLEAIVQRYGFSGKPEFTAMAVQHVAVLELVVEKLTGKQHLPA